MTGRFTDNLLGFRYDNEGLMISTCNSYNVSLVSPYNPLSDKLVVIAKVHIFQHGRGSLQAALDAYQGKRRLAVRGLGCRISYHALEHHIYEGVSLMK
ncbi:hypothetical protein PMAYCL1PPCAC_32392, partial [Pristionchus mayeri]